MARATEGWNVLPHGPLERLADNVRWVQGSPPRISLKRVMTVARLDDGRLVIHNGIALADIQMRQLEAFGTPAFLIVPNAFHRQDAAAFKHRYPELTVLAPSGSRAKVEQKVAVDGTSRSFHPTTRSASRARRGRRGRGRDAGRARPTARRSC